MGHFLLKNSLLRKFYTWDFLVSAREIKVDNFYKNINNALEANKFKLGFYQSHRSAIEESVIIVAQYLFYASLFPQIVKSKVWPLSLELIHSA